MIKISIVTASYNSSHFISDTIKSVLSQTYTNWEMLIVDDCSTDNSIEVIKEYCNIDSRIKLFSLEKNSGAAVSRNKGIEASMGSYIAFLDSDDLWFPDKLEKQLSFMISNNYSFTYTYYQKMKENGKKLDEIVKPPRNVTYKTLLRKNYIGCLTVMYSVDSLGKVYMPLIRKRQDYATWLKILRNGAIAHCLKENLAYYRLRENSISTNKLEMIKYNWILYRKVEKLSLLRSLISLSSVIFLKIINK